MAKSKKAKTEEIKMGKGNVCMPGSCKASAWSILIVGILFALQEYGVAIDFWNFTWYSILFILIGAHVLFCKCCK